MIQNEYNKDLSFYISFNYDSDRDTPAKVFQILAELIDAFYRIDNNLLSLFMLEVKSYFVLEELEYGSIRTKIITVLKSIDDESLKELDWKKFIGSFLVKAKYKVLKKLENKNEIKNIEEVKQIEEDLIELANETNIQKSIYPFPIQDLLKNLIILSQATANLKLNEEITYSCSEGEVKVNKSFKITEAAIESLLTNRTEVYETDIIVRIKKPDYLGKSMWIVYINNKACNVKIADYEWLYRFQNRQVEVRPGDSLKVRLKTITNFGYNNLEVSVLHEITKVYEVLTINLDQLDIYDFLDN